jgi:hypothetical protein
MNNYLNLAVETGIFGVLIYVFVLSMACVGASRNLLVCRSCLGMNLGLLCGVYSMLIFALTTYTLNRVYSNILVWTVLGYLASFDHIADGDFKSKIGN